jgi:hypothetical protein
MIPSPQILLVTSSSEILGEFCWKCKQVGLNVECSFLVQNRNVFAAPNNFEISNCSRFGTLLKVCKIMAVTTLLCGCQKLSKELTGRISFWGQWQVVNISLQNHWNRERSNLNQCIVGYRRGCQWVEYLSRTDYTHYHSVYTPMSRWDVGRPWERRKDWQPWSGISVKWLTVCC